MTEIIAIALLAVVACGISYVQPSMYADEMARQYAIEASMEKYTTRLDFIQHKNPQAHSVIEGDQ